MSRPRRWAVLAAVAGVQLAFVTLAVRPQLSARLTGRDYLLRVTPVDPIDPARGAYVALGYPDLALELSTARSGTVYVPLLRDGEVWRGGPVSGEPPPQGPFLRCHASGGRIDCGIDSYFLPQAEARRVQDAVSGGRTQARIRVDAAGNAALVDLVLNP